MNEATLKTTPQQRERPKQLGGCTGRGFLPGKSGNPNGQSEADRIVCEVAEQLTAQSLFELHRIGHDRRVRVSTRVKALATIERARRATVRRTPVHEAAEVAA